MSKIIFIPGNVPSLKNSKVKTSRGIFASPTVNKFIRSLGIQTYSASKKYVKGYVDKESRPNFIEKIKKELKPIIKKKGEPIFIGFHHVRKSKRLFDFSNSVEIIQDLFTAHNIIEDDNVKYMFPIPMTINGKLPTIKNIRIKKWYSVDKKNPGVFIKIF